MCGRYVSRSGSIIIPGSKDLVYTNTGNSNKTFGIGKIINIRSESAKSKFPTEINERRCIIPINSFIETNRDKQPFMIYSKEGQLNLAGVWRDDRFAILTTKPGQISNIHHRAPLIMSPHRAIEWLENGDYKAGMPKLTSFPIDNKSMKPIGPKYDHKGTVKLLAS